MGKKKQKHNKRLNRHDPHYHYKFAPIEDIDFSKFICNNTRGGGGDCYGDSYCDRNYLRDVIEKGYSCKDHKDSYCKNCDLTFCGCCHEHELGGDVWYGRCPQCKQPF